MVYMLCYDIRSPKRLYKTARILENYGIRVQKSFFQCEMSAAQLAEVKKAILGVIHHKKDSFFIYTLCQDCAAKAWTDGEGELIKITPYEIL